MRGVVRGVGTQRQGRQPDRRIQRLGRAPRPRCGCWAPPGCGSCSGPGSPTTACTSSGCTAPTASVTERADPFAFGTEVPPQTASRVTSSDYTWADDDWMTQRAQRNPVFEPMSTYEVHLGSWRPGLSYRQLAARADGLRCGAGVYPRRAAAGRRASVRRIVGLPGHVLLRADVAIRHTRRFPGARRRPAPGRHRRHRGLGAGALPQGRLGAGPLRRHPALRALRPQPRRATGLGHLRVRLRPSRGAKLPGGQRVVLARRVPHRRAAGGRGGVDAVPGLLAPRRRLDPQHLRRPREPGGGAVPAGDERDRTQGGAGHRHHRRGVDVLARA